MSFASNGSGPLSANGMSNGASLSDVGSLAGVASQVAGLTGMPGASVMGGAVRAVQLAQTGASLLGKTPASIADAINSASGAQPKLTQDNRFVTMTSPLRPDVLLVNALVVDEYVSQLPEIHLDLLSHRNNIDIDKIVGQLVSITLDPQAASTGLRDHCSLRCRPAPFSRLRRVVRQSGQLRYGDAL